MSMWSRNKLVRGTTYSEEINENRGLSLLVEGDPLSVHFKNPCGDKPQDLKNYLRALHIKTYGYTLALDDQILIRNFKLLLKEFEPTIIKRGIKFASKVSDFPYGTGFVKQMIEQIKEQI